MHTVLRQIWLSRKIPVTIILLAEVGLTKSNTQYNAPHVIRCHQNSLLASQLLTVHEFSTNKYLSCLVARVKNCWKEINTQPIIQGNMILQSD